MSAAASTPDATFAQARSFFERGIALLAQGDADGACAQFEAALSLVPGRPSALGNLGAAHLAAGRPQAALDPLEDAVRADPDHGDAWGHLAIALAQLNRPEQALAACERALALRPEVGRLWALQADLLREGGRLDAARTCHARALDLGWEPEMQRYALAGLGQAEPPPQPPAGYVEGLFSAYAPDFDRHLVDVLGYQAPQVLAAGLAGRRFGRALDLGCGTGLCAPLLRPLADRLDGLDLAAPMVEAARARGRYDEVLQGEVAAFLQATGRRYDLLVAADVFIYLGALEAVFEGAARVLQPGGLFCFSVEEALDGTGWQLQPSLRYAHAQPYLMSLAQRVGFGLRSLERQPLRIDRGQPLPGLFVWLERRGDHAD